MKLMAYSYYGAIFTVIAVCTTIHNVMKTIGTVKTDVAYIVCNHCGCVLSELDLLYQLCLVVNA